MKSKEELRSRQAPLNGRINQVKTQLTGLKNVKAVAIGLKESNGVITDEVCYRVMVAEKIPLDKMAPGDRIPSEIDGIKTDVLTPFRPVDRAFVERRDLKEYRPIKGGIAINSSRTRGSYGTLGALGKLTADNSNILLTNCHVLYSSSAGTYNTVEKMGQPMLRDCCCCVCKDMGTTLFGKKDANVDLAIGKISSGTDLDIVITNDTAAGNILRPNGTTDAAVVGEKVFKIGARSAFTTGKVLHIGDALAAPADPGGGGSPNLVVVPNVILIVPDTTETYEFENGKKAFSNFGDSGSVIINTSNEVIGLLYSGDSTTNTVDVTWANNISNVMSVLTAAGFTISISSTPAGRLERIGPLGTIPNLLPNIPNVNENHPLLILGNRFQDEIFNLISNNRQVGFTWNKFQGPSFIAAFARSTREPDYHIPHEIDGVPRNKLLGEMATVLLEFGSPDLRASILNNYAVLMPVLSHKEKIIEMIEAIDMTSSPILI